MNLLNANALTCTDCAAPITPTGDRGRTPKRCPECAKAFRRQSWRSGQHKRRRKAEDIYKFIEANAPVSVPDVYRQFPGTAKDFGAILARLQSCGFMCYLDERNRIYPYRRVTE